MLAADRHEHVSPIRKEDGREKSAVDISAVRTAWPATRAAHSFLKLPADSLNVLPSGFRFLDGDNPTDPLIARQRRNILPFCPRYRVRDENFS
jgi:hypothetical protein